MLHLRAGYLRDQLALQGRRRALTEQLQGAALASELQSAASAAEDALARDRLVHIMGGLRDCLRDEHSSLMKVKMAIMLRVLTPAQVAHLSVGTAPAPPDMLCLAEALGRLAGQPRTAVVLQGAASVDSDGAELMALDTASPQRMEP